MWKDGDIITAEKLNNMIYPVGSIYMSINSTNPSLLFGGTWEQIQGRYLIGAGTPTQNNNTNLGTLTPNELSWSMTPGDTFGEYIHQLTISEMPSHNHVINTANGQGAMEWGYQFSYDGNAGYNGMVSETGGNQAHNNTPPTLVVYIWKRTA